MKKLMMMAAVAACAIQAQAATTWTATIDFGKDYSGYSVWAVNGWNKNRPTVSTTETAPSTGHKGENYATTLKNSESDPETQISILNNNVKSDYNTWSGGYACLKNLTVGTDGKVSFTSSDVGNEQYSWLFVLTSDETATYGTEYAVVRAHESSDVVHGTVASPTYDVGDYTIAGAYASGGGIEFTTTGTIAIPEPTSGLLLLLGMAGLALKRKQRG